MERRQGRFCWDLCVTAYIRVYSSWAMVATNIQTLFAVKKFRFQKAGHHLAISQTFRAKKNMAKQYELAVITR